MATQHGKKRRITEEIALCEDALEDLNEKRYPCGIRLMRRQSFERIIRRHREVLKKLRAHGPCATCQEGFA